MMFSPPPHFRLQKLQQSLTLKSLSTLGFLWRIALLFSVWCLRYMWHGPKGMWFFSDFGFMDSWTHCFWSWGFSLYLLLTHSSHMVLPPPFCVQNKFFARVVVCYWFKVAGSYRERKQQEYVTRDEWERCRGGVEVDCPSSITVSWSFGLWGW